MKGTRAECENQESRWNQPQLLVLTENPTVHKMYSVQLVEGSFSFACIISPLVLLRMLPGAYIVAQHEAVIQSLQVPIQLEFSI